MPNPMTEAQARHSPAARPIALVAAGLAAAILTACGGSENPADNPPTIQNPAGATGQKLSFIYYQKCVHPIFLAQLRINQGGVISTNTCAAAGCHDNATGTGGALRLIGSAAMVDLANPANTPDAIRQTDMYKNFYSSQGEVVLGAPLSSRLLTKPLLLNVLHGGGLIFEGENDRNVQLIRYWISRPMPQGQDEFSSAANGMFTPADPNVGTCNTQ
jgi:hypothetical protein